MKKLITPDQIVAGMVLAEPIMGKSGQILYALNMKLENKHREMLKTWGIDALQVFVDDELIEEAEAEKKDEGEVRTQSEVLLKKRMKWIPRNNNEKDLFEMGIQTISENYF